MKLTYGFKRINWIIIVLLLMTLFITGCATRTSSEKKTVIIAEQYGLAYAPLQVLQKKAYIEEELGEEYTISWVKMSNTEAIREAMIAGQLDIGFVGIPPFLLGKDNGMDWKIMTGLSTSPLGLITNDPSIKSLENLVDAGKIALPQPGSIQHILLSMAAKRELGEGTLFDTQLISMKHPDGVLALAADNEVIGHFTAPPYLFQEMDNPNYHQVISGEEAMGEEFTFIVGVCRQSLYEDEVIYDAFLKALDRARDDIKDRDKDVIEYLSLIYELDIDLLEDYLYTRGIGFESKVVGTQTFIDFMFEEKYLNTWVEEDDVIYDEKKN